MINKNLSPKPRKGKSWLMIASKAIIRVALIILVTVLALAFGLWLVMASNMGPAYLPNILNGSLDIWIRGLLLALGLVVWSATAIWLIRYSYRYFRYLFRHIR